jgi:hypothetical protein
MTQDHFAVPAVNNLLSQAISEREVVLRGRYTEPRTWGVYEIEPPKMLRSTRRFRMGNHPVRQRQLEAEFGQAKLIALFSARRFAAELERLLNNR